jgi:hypothetical protein
VIMGGVRLLIAIVGPVQPAASRESSMFSCCGRQYAPSDQRGRSPAVWSAMSCAEIVMRLKLMVRPTGSLHAWHAMRVNSCWATVVGLLSRRAALKCVEKLLTSM